jgi:hypothetical protein
LFEGITIENSGAFVRAVQKEEGSVFKHTSSIDLPVTLKIFNAIRNKTGEIIIRWQTKQELMEGRTEVERSYNKKTFSTIGYLNPNKPAFSGKSYVFNDHPSFDSTVFYRLKQFDIDGHCTYSNVIEVSPYRTVQEGINIYPNPAKCILQIDLFARDAGIRTLSLYNISHSKLREQKFSIIKGRNVEQIDVSGLASGVYFLNLNKKEEKDIKIKFIKL